jgi:hypothetical protein
MRRRSPLICATVLLLAGCGPPDTRALQKLACEQAASSFDMASVAQLDALRKALGVAPGVDPIAHCRSLGARMEPPPAPASEAEREPGGDSGEN